jgi:hypothetical protein
VVVATAAVVTVTLVLLAASLGGKAAQYWTSWDGNGHDGLLPHPAPYFVFGFSLFSMAYSASFARTPVLSPAAFMTHKGLWPSR